MLRFLLVLPTYIIAATYLPRIESFGAFLDRLSRVPSDEAFPISMVVLALSSALVALSLKTTLGRRFCSDIGPGRVLQIGAIGGVFGGLSILFDVIGGRPAQLAYLIILPLAFMIAECVYAIVVWVWRKTRNSPLEATGRWETFEGEAVLREEKKEAEIAQEDEEATIGPSPLVRVFTYIFFYALVIGLLPQQDDFRRLMEPLTKVHPYWTLGLSVASLIIGGAVAYYASAYKAPHAPRENGQPAWGWVIIMGAAGGLAFGGLVNVISYLSGVPGDMETLIIVAIGLAVAEIVVALVHYRLNRRFD